MKCRKCNRDLSVGGRYDETDVEFYNCRLHDTGCAYIWFKVECPCGDSFETGDFGSFEKDEQTECLAAFEAEYRRTNAVPQV